MSAGRRRVRPTRRGSALNAVGRDVRGRHLADLTSSLKGDIDSGDRAPCSRCDAASECRRSGVGGEGGMRPGDLVRPCLLATTLNCCFLVLSKLRRSRRP